VRRQRSRPSDPAAEGRGHLEASLDPPPLRRHRHGTAAGRAALHAAEVLIVRGAWAAAVDRAGGAR
jgi:hypothetical protein